MLEVANEHPDFDYQLDLGNGTLELVREHCIGSLEVQEMSNCIGWVTNWLRSDKRKFNFTATALELLCLRLNHTREMLTREMTPQMPQTPPTPAYDDRNQPNRPSPNGTWSELYVPLLRDAAGRLSLTGSNSLRATVDTAAGENGFCARVITSVRLNWYTGVRQVLQLQAQDVQLNANQRENILELPEPLANQPNDRLEHKFRQALIAAGAPDNFAQEYIPPQVQNLFINSFTMLPADFDNLANPTGNPASCIAMRAIDVIRNEQSLSNRPRSDEDFDALLDQFEPPQQWIHVPPGLNTDLTPRPAYFYHKVTREVKWINPEANDMAVPVDLVFDWCGPPPPPPQQMPQQMPTEL